MTGLRKECENEDPDHTGFLDRDGIENVLESCALQFTSNTIDILMIHLEHRKGQKTTCNNPECYFISSGMMDMNVIYKL